MGHFHLPRVPQQQLAILHNIIKNNISSSCDMSRVADAYPFPHEEVLSHLSGRTLASRSRCIQKTEWCRGSATSGTNAIEDVVEKLSEMLSRMQGDETVAEAAERVEPDLRGMLRRSFLDAVRLLGEAGVEVVPGVDMDADEISYRVHKRRFHDLLLRQIEMLSPGAIRAAVFAL